LLYLSLLAVEPPPVEPPVAGLDDEDPFTLEPALLDEPLLDATDVLSSYLPDVVAVMFDIGI